MTMTPDELYRDHHGRHQGGMPNYTEEALLTAAAAVRAQIPQERSLGSRWEVYAIGVGSAIVAGFFVHRFGL